MTDRAADSVVSLRLGSIGMGSSHSSMEMTGIEEQTSQNLTSRTHSDLDKAIREVEDDERYSWSRSVMSTDPSCSSSSSSTIEREGIDKVSSSDLRLAPIEDRSHSAIEAEREQTKEKWSSVTSDGESKRQLSTNLTEADRDGSERQGVCGDGYRESSSPNSRSTNLMTVGGAPWG